MKLDIFQRVQTPNITKGSNTAEFVVLHDTLGSYNSALNWLTIKKSNVSAHFLVRKDGKIAQLAEITQITWHAGVVKNPATKLLKMDKNGNYINPNFYCVGIEVECIRPNDVWTKEQYESVANIILYVKDTTRKVPTILAHKDITDYKSDTNTKNKNEVFELVYKKLQAGLNLKLAAIGTAMVVTAGFASAGVVNSFI